MTDPKLPAARTITPKLAGTVLLLAGLGLAVITVLVERHQEKIFAGAVHTTGTVVALLPRGGSGNSRTYAPIVRYHTNDGTSVDFTASPSSNSQARKVGDVVPVVYTPLNPGQADIDSWTSRWLLTALCAGLTCVLIGIGSVAMIRYR